MLTSSTEGYGLVAFEALTLGVPCVVSNVGGLPSIVDNFCGKLCNIDEDFIDEVSELICNHDYYVYKQKKSREKSAKLDNFSAYMQNINAMYESLFMEGMWVIFMKKITVFTPTFNRINLLENVYKSLLNQTSKDFIWLIIDDGSTDNTENVVKRWIEEKKN